MKAEEISVILPVYNEESSIKQVVHSGLELLPGVSSKFEFIIVDDGSRDKSPQIINQLCRENSSLKVIRHERNMGYGRALASGFSAAVYPLVFFMDCDGQFDIYDIKKLLIFINEFDIVAGIRRERIDPSYRILFGKLYNGLNSFLFNIKTSDISCGFKLLRKSVLENMVLYSKSGFINTEIMVKARQNGNLIKEVAVKHYSRRKGRQKGASAKALFLKVSEIASFFWLVHS